mgnify:CR=1 FL=1
MDVLWENLCSYTWGGRKSEFVGASLYSELTKGGGGVGCIGCEDAQEEQGMAQPQRLQRLLVHGSGASGECECSCPRSGETCWQDAVTGVNIQSSHNAPRLCIKKPIAISRMMICLMKRMC